MFSKIVLTGVLLSSVSWSMNANMVQKASKNELGCIKGLGKKRVEALINYRNTKTIYSLNELLEIKGIGKVIVANIANDIEKKVCTNFDKRTIKKKKKNKKKISAE